jgi:hypothetical protein
MTEPEKIIKEVTNPVTKPLTEERPSFAAFAIGGFAAPAIDAVAVKAAGYAPPVLNNPLAVGFVELATAYGMSRIKTKNQYLRTAKTGAEVGLAVAGSRNIVIAGRNFINNRQTATAKVKTATRRVF